MWLNKRIRVGGTNQFGTNTCNHNKKMDLILDHLHLYQDFSKSPINEYSDFCDLQLHDETCQPLNFMELNNQCYIDYPN